MAKEENTPTAAQKKAAASSEAAAPVFVPAPVVPTNVLSIISLVTGLLGFTFAPFIGSVAAVITGHLALHQIKNTKEQGHGMAVAGLILGYVVLGLILIGVALLVTLFFVSMAGMNGNQLHIRGGI